MKKKLVLLFFSCILILSTITFNAFDASAAELLKGKKAFYQSHYYGDDADNIFPMHLGNVYDRNNVWFDNSAKTITFNGSPIYSRAIMAIGAWNKTTSGVKLSETSNYDKSAIRVYSVYRDYDYYGMTTVVDFIGNVCTTEKNSPSISLKCFPKWQYAKVLVNHDSIADVNKGKKETDPEYIDYYDVFKIISHEFGHALGLQHQYAIGSIMVDGQREISGGFYNPQQVDLDNLKAVYTAN